MRKYLPFVFLFLTTTLFAQVPGKKKLDHSDFDVWKTISQATISNNGKWATYALTVERGDPEFCIHNIDSGKSQFFERGTNGKISADNQFVVFSIKTPLDSIKAMKRRKVKKKNMPADTLAIYNLNSGNLVTIPDVKAFKIPRKWSDWLAYEVKASAPETKDSSDEKSKKKPEDFLIIKKLSSDFELKIPGAKSYVFADEAPKILVASESKDSTFEQGVYLFDAKTEKLDALLQSEGKFNNLTFDKQGNQAVFMADLDTTDAKIRPFHLYFWNQKEKSTKIIVDNTQDFLPKDWRLTEHGQVRFSDNGNRLFFGIAPTPALEDTTLLDEEKVAVEVWSWKDARLYTQQEVQVKDDKKKAYDCVWDLSKNRFTHLEDLLVDNIKFDAYSDGQYAFGAALEPYMQTVSWEGFPEYRDMYRVDIASGKKSKFATKVKGTHRVSPAGNYFYWFNAIDTVWQTYHPASDQLFTVTSNQTVPFYDELNDRPMLPNSYNRMGFTQNDQHMLIYDRYDIWIIDPMNKNKPQRLTKGRDSHTRYRYIKTDPEEKYIDTTKDILLAVFNEKTKQSGYAKVNFNTKKVTTLVLTDHRYDTTPIKAKDADRFLITKEDFQMYPNLRVVDADFKTSKQISDANPQQGAYNWGSIELYEWTSADGEKLQGLLVKPEGFDPNKKYPMIVNFYERSSDRLHRHQAPYPGRSTINYSFYASRGYLIFNPDVPYTVGYPGESAERSVISGTLALIAEGFVDEERIGVQGHSWGGYQIAHLITRTNIFRCAESGAPVVNMFSAYGGIRWGSGLSRMFQYENTQSRIGGTIWEYPVRYMENSPIFFMDKVETPVLILHNDKDGAVPWYQGIEFFVALRRLGKPAWMLNYNDEPHWPVKRQNRLDFNVRMQQFFDHYLMDQPMPEWMEKGIPAVEKGINMGLEMNEKE